MIGSHDPTWMFCGYRIDIISQFGANSASVHAITPTGFSFAMKARLNPIEEEKAGIEGTLSYRYIPVSDGLDRSVCQSDGYSLAEQQILREMP